VEPAQAQQPATPTPVPRAGESNPVPPLPAESANEPGPLPTPAATPPAQRPAPRPTITDTRPRTPRARTARSPEMFGDQFVAIPLAVDGLPTGGSGESQEFATIVGPTSVNAFSQKISENNHPLPRDRVFYTFNYFNDALKFDSSYDGFFGTSSTTQSLLRHTLGVEKTFNEGDSSIEVRLPFNTGTSFSRTDTGQVWGYDGGTLGNVMLTGKTLIYEGDQFLASTGMGVILPTAADTRFRANSTTVTVDNSAVYLSPFLGSLWTPNDQWFVMAFGQVQFSANGDPIIVRDSEIGSTSRVAVLNAPSVLSVDLSVGRWLFRDHEGLLQGMALISEFHQFTALQGNDGIGSGGVSFIGPRSSFSNDRLSLTTFTFGVHNQLAGNSTLRIAGVLPVDNQYFNGELIVQFNYFY
ncbi:MAG TPA: hypothetical protein VM510_05105, partial [Caulifigura sp.]|nr:hypothetical protein [Caulifigura sp.]